jgi:phenylalanyl-tRNA synthetase alpha chain
VHPYTTEGLQIDVDHGDDWVEVGECGLAAAPVLAGASLDGASGLAMGLGLDRILMLRKGVADIRLLRAADPRVADQMRDVSLYRPVSNRPPIARDLSVAVDEHDDTEVLGDRVRDALGDAADAVEAVEVLSETTGDELPAPARDRLGLRAGQKNVLLRVVLRHHDRTLTRDEANELRDRVYAALHRGTP